MHKFIPFLLLCLIFYSCESLFVETSHWPNGNLRSEIAYTGEEKDGEKLYTFRSYYDDGAPQIEGFLLGDAYHGEWKEYYLNGQVLRVGQYHKGSPQANFTEYHANGTLRAKYRYNKLSQLQGEYQLFNLNGKVLVEGQYHQSKKIGTWTYQFDGLEMEDMIDADYPLGLATIKESRHCTPDPREEEFVSYWTYILDVKGNIGVVYTQPSPDLLQMSRSGMGRSPISHAKHKPLYGKDLGFEGPVKKETDPYSSKKIIEYGELGPKLIAYWEDGKQIVKEGTGNIERKVILETGTHYVWCRLSYDYLRGYSTGTQYYPLEYYKK